jgi:translocation and assembly module TamB
MKGISRRLWIMIGLLGASLFILGALGGIGVPKLKSWMLIKIEKVSEAESPIKILPTSIGLHLFPLSITIEKVRITPKPELQGMLDPFIVGEIGVKFGFFKLFTGKLKIEKLTIRDTEVDVRIPQSHKAKARRPLEGLFAALKKIPLQEIEIENTKLKLFISEPRTEVILTGLELSAEKYNDELGITLSSESIYFKDLKSKADLRVSTDAKVFLTPDRIIVSHFNLQRGDSHFVLKGSARGDIEGLKFNDYDFKAQGNLSLDSLSVWAAKALGENNQMPLMSGTADINAELKLAPGRSEEYKFDLKAEKLKIAFYYLGDIETKGTLLNKIISLPKLSVQNDSLNAVIENLKINLNEKIEISALAKINKLSIHELFKNLGLKEIPLWLKLNAELPCQAELKPSFLLKCNGSLEAHDLLLKPGGHTDRTIVKVDSISAKGSLQVDPKAISFDAHLLMPNSKGAAQGAVIFKEGFQVKYIAENLNFKDISNLSDLKIEGNTQIAGETSGDSHAATMALQLIGTDLWLSNFWLGNAKTTISYKAGKLNFANLYGKYPNSNYQADVNLNIPESRISVLGRSPKIDAGDMLLIFNRKVKLPFTMTGNGSLQAKIWGPLQFNKLSYDIRSQINSGTVWREPFEHLFFDIHSRDGEVAIDRVQLARGAEVISLSGVGHPNGDIDVKGHAQSIKLEESPNFANLGLSITSVAEFDLKLAGYVLKPDADLYGKLTKSAVADQSVADSNFHMKFREKTIESQGSFLGDIIRTDVIIPLNDEAPFMMKLNTKDWNFAPLLASVKLASSKKDFDSHLTSEINLTSSKGGLWNSSGKIAVQRFDLKRGALAMSAPKEILLKVRDGQFHVESFNLVGQNTSLRVTDSAPLTDKIDWQINGKLDMNLIALLLPFFEELRGELSFACNLTANQTKADLIGSAYVDHGYLKIFDFVHPFDEIKADILFNKKKVLINSLKADFAGGILSGDGNLEIRGYRDIPFQLNAVIDKVSLKVPDQFVTKGSGKITLSGTWFPFLLKGNYDISDGLVTKEFGGDDSKQALKPNQYLPKNLSEENQSPLLLDLDINFAKGLPIKNAQVDGVLKGELAIKGIPQKPSIIGSVSATTESKVKFNEKAFDVIAANFTFDDPKEINPKIYVNSKSHIDASNSRGTEYDVNLLIQGTAQKPVIILSSQPALSQPDIISLLALGTTSTNIGSNVGSSQQGANTSFILGSAVLQKNPIGKELKDRFNVDLQFTSGFDDTNNIAVQKISLSGKFNEKLGWIYNRALGSKSENEAHLKYKLSNRFSLVGNFVNHQADETTGTTQSTTENIFGLDLDYRFQFK